MCAPKPQPRQMERYITQARPDDEGARASSWPMTVSGKHNNGSGWLTAIYDSSRLALLVTLLPFMHGSIILQRYEMCRGGHRNLQSRTPVLARLL